MAEVIGLVASVIAIGQVAGAVGKTVLRLKSLWNEVKDVPERISDLLEELEMLDPLLKEIDKQLGHNSLPKEVWDDSSTKLSKLYCQKAMDSLCSMANDLDKEIKQSRGKLGRKIASAKAVLKKDSIIRHEKKLKKAMRHLKASMDCYSLAMTRVSYEMARSRATPAPTEFDVVVQISPAETGAKGPIEDDEDEEPQSSSQPLVRSDPRRASWSGFFGSITYRSSKDGKSYRVRLQPPAWLTLSIWEFESRRAHSCWQQINLRVYNTRRADADVFRVVMYGDYDQLMEMFDKGEASPFDCDPNGQSLLHYATKQSHVAICQALLEFGLHTCIDEQGDYGTPRSSVLRWSFSYAGVLLGSSSELSFLERRIAIMDLFSKFDIEECAYANTSPKWEVGFLSQLEGQRASSYHTLPLRQRLLAVRNNVYRDQWRAYNPKALGYLINKDCRLLKEDITQSVREGVSLIHSCALALGAMSGIDGIWKLDEWNPLAREIISASTLEELHTVEECEISGVNRQPNWRGTPLISLFRGFTVQARNRNDWRDCFILGLRNWLEQLIECSVDLVQYGQREKAYLSSHAAETGGMVQFTFELSGLPVRYLEPMELCDIEFGPAPEDWVIVWDLDIFQMVGEFFEGVEEQREAEERQRLLDSRYMETLRRIRRRSTRPSRSRMPGGWVD